LESEPPGSSRVLRRVALRFIEAIRARMDARRNDRFISKVTFQISDTPVPSNGQPRVSPKGRPMVSCSTGID
jgi:hypothetical protein